MPKGKMSAEEIVIAVQGLIKNANDSGEKLTGASIARRVGCGRTTLYTNPKIKQLLLQAGIIDDNMQDAKENISHDDSAVEKKETSLLEKRLQKTEERANRLELLLAEAQETIKLYEMENQKLKIQNSLILQGKSIL